MAGSEEELKSLLMGGSETQHQKSKIMAFGPIISWQIEAEKVEAVTDFPSFVSKITEHSDCSHEI